MSKQSQKGGNNSTNIQVSNLTIVEQGLTYEEARKVALDVFRANFCKLAGEAKEIAAQRAEQVTEEFLKKLQRENPSGFAKAKDPDFQYALFTVQTEYARSGDTDLGGLLIDLLVDRSKHDQRDILQIVLNESLNVAPKLTKNQLAALAIIFLFKYTQNYSLGNHDKLGQYFDKMVRPFVELISKKDACYRHLECSGCGSISIGFVSLEKILGTTYQGLFLKGFESEEIKKRQISIGVDSRVFMRCLNDQSKLQVGVVNLKALEKYMDSENVSEDDRKKIIALFNLNKMHENEIREKTVGIRPYMENVFDVWSNSFMKNFGLTSVGIAIGHANIKRLVGEFADLSIWIN